MTAKQFPTTLMRNVMWSEQLCICEFFKTWTPVWFHNHVLVTLRRYIWRLVGLRMTIFHPNVRLAILYNTVFGWTVLTYFKRSYEHLNGAHSSPKITGHAKTVGHPVNSSNIVPFTGWYVQGDDEITSDRETWDTLWNLPCTTSHRV